MCVIIDRLSTLKCVLAIVSQLNWAWDFLFDPIFYTDKIGLPEIVVDYDELGIKYYEKNEFGDCDNDDVECSICLCQIEVVDEVRELKCSHFFHRICLDRWLGNGRLTCPLCRGNLRQRVPSSSSAVNSRETLFFNFCDVGSSGPDKWWLR